jgi:predicted amidohydrolase
VKITLGQFAPTADLAANRTSIEALVRSAVEAGSDLLVLPEEAMVLGSQTSTPLGDVATTEWLPFTEFVRDLAKANGIGIVAPGYEPGSSGLPYNTIVVSDRTGALVATYRKMHLYDAFSYRESSYVMRGEVKPTVFAINGTVFGLLNCYDLRFPELARALVELGADTLLVSAAWMSGPLKIDHWLTLLRARAIENTCWVIGVGSSSAECIGVSTVVDPMGQVLDQLGDEAIAAIHAEVSKERLDEARYTLPVLLNRRIMINGS